MDDALDLVARLFYGNSNAAARRNAAVIVKAFTAPEHEPPQEEAPQDEAPQAVGETVKDEEE